VFVCVGEWVCVCACLWVFFYACVCVSRENTFKETKSQLKSRKIATHTHTHTHINTYTNTYTQRVLPKNFCMQVSNRKCCWHLHSKTVDKSNCAIGYCCSNILSMVRCKLFNINLVQGFDRFQNYFFSGTLKQKNINLAYLLVGTAQVSYEKTYFDIWQLMKIWPTTSDFSRMCPWGYAYPRLGTTDLVHLVQAWPTSDPWATYGSPSTLMWSASYV